MERECRHKGEYYTCKRLRLLTFLKNKGFIPFLTIPDANNPKFNVWKFYNTPALEEAIDEYFDQLNNK